MGFKNWIQWNWLGNSALHGFEIQIEYEKWFHWNWLDNSKLHVIFHGVLGSKTNFIEIKFKYLGFKPMECSSVKPVSLKSNFISVWISSSGSVQLWTLFHWNKLYIYLLEFKSMEGSTMKPFSLKSILNKKCFHSNQFHTEPLQQTRG